MNQATTKRIEGLVVEDTNINSTTKYELQLDDCTHLFKNINGLVKYADKHNIDLVWEEEDNSEYDYGF